MIFEHLRIVIHKYLLIEELIVRRVKEYKCYPIYLLPLYTISFTYAIDNHYPPSCLQPLLLTIYLYQAVNNIKIQIHMTNSKKEDCK